MKLKFRKELKLGFREKLIIFCPAVGVAILAFVVAFYFIDPLPPRRISIGCGPPEGANFKSAQVYREILSREGIALELRNTAGSAENLKLLGAESDGVDVAFVQGSTKSLVQNTDLVSLGSLFFEPVWFFYREESARALPQQTMQHPVQLYRCCDGFLETMLELALFYQLFHTEVNTKK